MKIFLIRHADAVEPATDLPDPARFLSLPGRRAARAVGQRLRAERVGFDAVVSSPLVRAVQTAELIAERVDFTDVVTVLPALLPSVPARVVAEALVARGNSIAAVGHEPHLAQVCAILIGQPSFPPLRKSQVVLIEDGRAVWALDPDQLEIRRLS